MSESGFQLECCRWCRDFFTLKIVLMKNILNISSKINVSIVEIKWESTTPVESAKLVPSDPCVIYIAGDTGRSQSLVSRLHNVPSYLHLLVDYLLVLDIINQLKCIYPIKSPGVPLHSPAAWRPLVWVVLCNACCRLAQYWPGPK